MQTANNILHIGDIDMGAYQNERAISKGPLKMLGSSSSAPKGPSDEKTCESTTYKIINIYFPKTFLRIGSY
jgi:hypothetical protein